MDKRYETAMSRSSQVNLTRPSRQFLLTERSVWIEVEQMVVPLHNTLALKQAVKLMDDLSNPGDVDWALRKVEIGRHLIEGPPVFLPLGTTAKLTEALARRTGERHLGALIGQHSKYEDLSWYSKYVLAAPNLGQAFQRGAKALPFVQPGCRVSFDRRDDHIVLLFHSRIQSIVGAHHLDEFMPTFFTDLVRHFLGSQWSPTWAELPKNSIVGKNELEAIYGVPIVFRPGGAGIAMALDDMAAPNPRKILAKNEVLLRDLPGLIGISPPETFSELVMEIMRFQIILGDISIEAIAERLSVSVQTLQRRLRTEGTSFRMLRSEFLKLKAMDLLTQTNHSVSEISKALGYEETNSFRRAFQVWYGVTPTQFSFDRRR